MLPTWDHIFGNTEPLKSKNRGLQFLNRIFDKLTTRHVIHTYPAGNGISASYIPTTSYGSNYFSGAKFPGGIDNPMPIDIHNHYAIRQQVRRAMYDSIEGRALVTTIVDTVAGTGPRVKPTPIVEILGITAESGEKWGEDVGTRFHLWAQSKKSHRSRINNFYQNTRLYEFFKQRDNDVFVRLYYGRDWDSLGPLQMDFLDPNQIRGGDYTSSYAQTPSDDGIVRDAAGRETGYKIWTMDINGKYTETTVPAIGEKSGRIMMLHGFNPEYAGQGRGYSKLAHMIQELSDLTGFKIAVLQKAINQASLMAAVENDIQDASNPVTGRVAGPVAQYGLSGEDTGATTTPSTTEPTPNWNVMPEATLRQPSVLIGNLRRGDKWKNLQDTSPTPGFDAYCDSVFSYLAASTGWAKELVLKQFSNNFSASRGTLLLCYRTAQIERNETRADFLDPVYEMWLSEEIAAGRVSAPGWSDPLLRAAWLCADWSSDPVPNIDPLKTMEADKGYVALGAQTLDDVARNLNGSSGKANRAKLARQYSELPDPPWENKAPTGNNNQNVDENDKSQEGGNRGKSDSLRLMEYFLAHDPDIFNKIFAPEKVKDGDGNG